MPFEKEKHHRKSIRLPQYDYSQNGAYFITICTHNRECVFGKIEDGKMTKNELGEMVEKFWQEIPEHFPNVVLDAFVVMPNHIHGILIIDNDVKNLEKTDGDIQKIAGNIFPVGVQDFEPLHENQFQHIIPRSIGSIVRGFKIGVTKYTKTIGFSQSI